MMETSSRRHGWELYMIGFDLPGSPSEPARAVAVGHDAMATRGKVVEWAECPERTFERIVKWCFYFLARYPRGRAVCNGVAPYDHWFDGMRRSIFDERTITPITVTTHLKQKLEVIAYETPREVLGAMPDRFMFAAALALSQVAWSASSSLRRPP